MRRFIAFGPAFVVLLATLVALLGVPEAVRRIGYANTEATIRMARQSLDDANVLEKINAAVRNIAKAVEPSVVHIAVETTSRGAVSGQRISQGSGWVFDARGDIVTNAHVIRGNASRSDPQITVQYYDGRTARADIVGIDPAYDIAVIRVVSTEGLFPARRGTGVELSQGDRVYAFGSPFGFKFSMSEGIVSGLGRNPAAVVEEGGYTNFIQTDAAVNPGNSGGPLCDIYGRVVGMNVAIATGTSPSGTSEGQSSGISFAIPLDTIESVVQQLIAGGSVAKGYIGITLPGRGGNEDADAIEETNRALMENAGYHGRGVYVERVGKGTPAESAGMNSGDIIVAINSKPVTGMAALRQLISINRPGDRLVVRIWRKGETQELNVVLADLAVNDLRLRGAQRAVAEFGVLDYSIADAGITVGRIRASSPAAKIGLTSGMTITKLAGQLVTGDTSFFSILAEEGFGDGKPIEAEIITKPGHREPFQLQLPRN